MSDLSYWANASQTEIGAKAAERIKTFYDWMTSSGLLRVIRKSVAMSAGAAVDSGAASWEIREAGEQGEFKLSSENHYSAIGEHKHALTTISRPAITCEAANSDTKSIEQADLGNGLIEDHLTDRGAEALLKQANQKAIYQGEGFIYGVWDALAGDELGPDPEGLKAAMEAEAAGQKPQPVSILYAGEPEFHVLGPLDVVRDPYSPSFDKCPWVIVRLWQSKWELAARYPEFAQRLAGLTFAPEKSTSVRLEFGRQKGGADDTDLIPVWTLLHKRTKAMPDGRIVIFASDDVVLMNGPLPFKELPLHRERPQDIEGTPFGWSSLFNLLGPQDIVNAVDTAIVSNEMGRGIGNLLVPDEADISVEALSASMTEIKYKGAQKPEPLEWPETPKEFFGYKQSKVDAMANLAGTNPVAMGTPNADVGKDGSGAKMALFEATAARNNSSLEGSHVELIRGWAEMVLDMYRTFGGSTERKVKIAGKSRGYLVKAFTSDDLQDIERVKVEIANPILRTPTGKLELAKEMVSLGVIEKGRADKFLHIVKEGTADPFYEAAEAELLLIRGENEALMDGSAEHIALITDNHIKHLREHKSLMDNPSLRQPTPENQMVQARILASLDAHMQQLQAMPPWMAALMPPEDMALYQEIAAMMLGATGASGTAPPQPGEPTATEMPEQGGGQSSTEGPAMPQQPSMPKNPATQERARIQRGPLEVVQ